MPFGVGTKVEHKEVIDYDKNKFVPVICSYDVEGNCIPLYFGLKLPTDERQRIQIDRIQWYKPNAKFGMIYCCSITLNESSSTVYIYYHKDLNKWSLRKS